MYTHSLSMEFCMIWLLYNCRLGTVGFVVITVVGGGRGHELWWHTTGNAQNVYSLILPWINMYNRFSPKPARAVCILHMYVYQNTSITMAWINMHNILLYFLTHARSIHFKKPTGGPPHFIAPSGTLWWWFSFILRAAITYALACSYNSNKQINLKQ